MDKKFFALLGAFVVIASMSAVCALDLNDLSNVIYDSPNDENVTVSGIDFNVPDGFNEAKNEAVDSMSFDSPYVDYNISGKKLISNNGSSIAISVSESVEFTADDSSAEIASQDGNKTTIKGINGYEFYDDGTYGFSFAKDGKLVLITASEKELIDDVLIA